MAVLSALHRYWVTLTDYHNSAFGYRKAASAIVFWIDFNMAAGWNYDVLVDDSLTHDGTTPYVCAVHQHRMLDQST